MASALVVIGVCEIPRQFLCWFPFHGYLHFLHCCTLRIFTGYSMNVFYVQAQSGVQGNGLWVIWWRESTSTQPTIKNCLEQCSAGLCLIFMKRMKLIKRLKISFSLDCLEAAILIDYLQCDNLLFHNLSFITYCSTGIPAATSRTETIKWLDWQATHSYWRQRWR